MSLLEQLSYHSAMCFYSEPGYISTDDIFALQAMLMQKSEVFLRVRGAVSSLCYTVCVWWRIVKCSPAVVPCRYSAGCVSLRCRATCLSTWLLCG
jgi:hypothetical protein